jgi:hypothetical protein
MELIWTFEANNILKQSPYLTKTELRWQAGRKSQLLIKTFERENIISLKKGFYISSYYLDIVSQDFTSREGAEYLANILRFPSYVSLNMSCLLGIF